MGVVSVCFAIPAGPRHLISAVEDTGFEAEFVPLDADDRENAADVAAKVKNF